MLRILPVGTIIFLVYIDHARRTKPEPLEAYGYLWWIDTDENLIWADCYGGQYMLIDPATGLVFVQRNFTGNSLMSSGLFKLDDKKDSSHKYDLQHMYERTKKCLEKQNARKNTAYEMV